MPESRSSRQDWKIAAAESGTQSRIVDAARRHFLAHGFRNVTMDDLAVELGMSKKTFYAHFPGKVALVESVLGAKLDAAEADMERITSKSGEGFAGTPLPVSSSTRRRSSHRFCATSGVTRPSFWRWWRNGGRR